MDSRGILLRFPDGLRMAPVDTALPPLPPNVVRLVPRDGAWSGPPGPAAA